MNVTKVRDHRPPETEWLIFSTWPLVCRLRVSPHPPGRRDGDAAAHDHGLANGHCRGPRGPSVLRAIPSLPDSGRNADASTDVPLAAV